ncbi:MAG TPA: M48 family metalloprotease [Solirubrobacteraceae bacterium]|nr:M48 family metalloprotease [Solirubrobacteraceae bacterium]
MSHPNGAPWPLALAGAHVTAGAAMFLLRPRDGSIEPDPVDVDAYFSADDIARARRFGRPQLALQLVAGAAQVLALAGVAVCGGAGRPRPAAPSSREELMQSAIAGARLSLAVGLAPLPLRALARRRALAAGLATQTWRGWVRDLAKSGALGAGLDALAAPAALALMRRRPRDWWLPASGIAVVGAGALALLAPLTVDRLFNRFRPLPGGPIRDDVLELADRAGVEVGEVYVVDASSRTAAANAYVSGLGPSRRVVLFDTLLREFTREEIRLVVAHELAHVRHRDISRGLAHLALSAPAAMYAAAQLTPDLQRRLADAAAGEGTALCRRLGIRPGSAAGAAPDSAAVLPALVLSLGAVSAVVGGFAAALSRRVERRADAFALALADAPAPFVSCERRLVRSNLADPDPPRWLVGLIGTHPPAVQRIGIALAYQRGARPAVR